MGIAPDLEKAGSLSVPFIAFVAPPVAMSVLSGRKLAPADMDIAVRMMSNGQPHRATPLTGALCLAVATRLNGSIPNALALGLAADATSIRIGHPSGNGIRRPDAKVTAEVKAARLACPPNRRCVPDCTLVILRGVCFIART